MIIGGIGLVLTCIACKACFKFVRLFLKRKKQVKYGRLATDEDEAEEVEMAQEASCHSKRGQGATVFRGLKVAHAEMAASEVGDDEDGNGCGLAPPAVPMKSECCGTTEDSQLHELQNEL